MEVNRKFRQSRKCFLSLIIAAKCFGKSHALKVQGMRTLSMSSIQYSSVKVISLDITGTILVHRYPIMETYADAAVWARLPNPPTVNELKPAFKAAYYKHLTESPCFGHEEGLSSRQWWVRTVKSALEFCGRGDYSESEFNRFFRRVYQHYGSLEGYELLPDGKDFLSFLQKSTYSSIGVTTNSPTRTLETVLPMLGIHNNFKWFVCSQDIGVEKPGKGIFDATYEQAKFWTPELQRHEILHIGDNFAADYCGARAAGFQALYLDRSNNPRVTVYQDWLQGPDYPGKSEEDIQNGTVKDLNELTLGLIKRNDGVLGTETMKTGLTKGDQISSANTVGPPNQDQGKENGRE
eukprot:gene6373-12886_t